MARPRRSVVQTVLALVSILIISCIWISSSWTEGHWDAQAPWSARSLGNRADTDAPYVLGVGKADITGPVVEINLMGYADPAQVGSGVRQRIYSRAFIVADARKPSDCFVYIVLDAHSGDTAIRQGILEGLQALGPEYAIYGQNNVALTGTHSHSGPGAWLNYLLPQITSKGFDQQSYRAIVDGTLLSIRRAHESRAPGTLAVGTTRVPDASINRSLYAYLANPQAERDRYGDDVDRTLTLLRFRRAADGRDLGVLTWFPVHGTSMLGNNTLVTGDNKGVAAGLFEAAVARERGAGGFVAGFSQANVGDTTPNVLGAFCEDTGEPCSFKESTCGGRSQPCHGRGPFWGLDDGGARSCFEIGRRQYQAAFDLFQSMQAADADGGGQSSQSGGIVPVAASGVGSIHSFASLADYTFKLPNGSTVTTCPAALGYAFAAGTTDGPGALDFTQTGRSTPFWNIVRSFIHAPSKQQEACQAPKPILLDVGALHLPYEWSPAIVDIQLLRVGQLVIIASPGEATTMAGRRWREAVAAAVASTGLGGTDPDPIVVLGGPANTYTHYIATEDEYQVQRYEGASTLFGPHTLAAYIDLSLSRLPALWGRPRPAAADDAAPRPPINTNRSLALNGPVVYDTPGFGRRFGQVLRDADPTYPSNARVAVTFVGANPRNDLRLEGTFVAVEQRVCADRRGAACGWRRVRDDADWDLWFAWRRTNGALGTSEVTVTWDLAALAAAGWGEVEGRFRIRYWGDEKRIVTGGIHPFEGTSREFVVTKRT